MIATGPVTISSSVGLGEKKEEARSAFPVEPGKSDANSKVF